MSDPRIGIGTGDGIGTKLPEAFSFDQSTWAALSREERDQTIAALMAIEARVENNELGLAMAMRIAELVCAEPMP